MTMTARAALPSPPDPAAYHDPRHPTYGFYTEEWHDIPQPTNGSEWFSSEERYRREANAHAYKQHGTPQNWLRYLTLGFFVYDDCSKFDTVWMKYSADPITCHRMVWYNFMYHLDRQLELPTTLSAWATDVSQPYLQRHSPHHLALNTLDTTWTDYIRGEHDTMDIESTQWRHVGSKKTKTQESSILLPLSKDVSPTTAHGLPETDQESFSGPDTRSAQGSLSKAPASVSFNQSDHTFTASSAPDNDSEILTHSDGNQKNTLSSNKTTASDSSSIDGKQSALQPDLNVPTNDGTYRLTFRWNPKGDFNRYNEKSTLWLTDVHAMLSDLFSGNDCFFYRWESRDLQHSTEITTLSPGELRDFLSPNITFLPSTSQVIFGVRVCFAAKFPGEWRGKENTVKKLAEYKLQVNISNSTTTSGRIVTAGYILFKAARTTHRTRFLQSLRLKLPKETPFFDILLFHRTPMEQKINHLVIQCGETHVSPLSQALSALLTGHNSPLFLPRLALSRLQPSQISAYFEMQDLYAKSLKSYPLFPTLINLDKRRKEIYDNGTVIERSTREWASKIFKDTDDPAARCEVVNGGYDQKAYLLVPKMFAHQAAEQLRQYRLRINPIGRREARFRDSLPGLPSVIHIDCSTQRNLDLLEHMSSNEVWMNAPPSVRGISAPNNKKEDFSRGQPQEGFRSYDKNPFHQHERGKRSGTTGQKISKSDVSPPAVTGSEIGDDHTVFTQSATQSGVTPTVMSSATTRRLNELEALFRQQQQETAEISTLTSQSAARLGHIELKLGRIDDMDAVLNDNRDKLAITMERQQDSHVQIVDLNIRVSKLMDVIDRMASRIEVLTEAMVKSDSAPEQPCPTTVPNASKQDGTRRRSLAEMTDLTTNNLHDEAPNPSSMSTTHKRTENTLSLPDHRSLSTNTITSPTKKKSRSLQDTLEEMSLGSDEFDDELPNDNFDFSQQLDSNFREDSPNMDDSDELSSHTPDLDTQYKSKSDLEGGACE